MFSKGLQYYQFLQKIMLLTFVGKVWRCITRSRSKPFKLFATSCTISKSATINKFFKFKCLKKCSHSWLPSIDRYDEIINCCRILFQFYVKTVLKIKIISKLKNVLNLCFKKSNLQSRKLKIYLFILAARKSGQPVIVIMTKMNQN